MPDLRPFALAASRAWYILLLVLSALLALYTATLDGLAWSVLFGGAALYFLVRYLGVRRAPPPASPGVEDGAHERGGMPLAVIAVAAILLAGSAASLFMDASTGNPPGNGICDFDRSAAVVVYETGDRGGTVQPAVEFCADHVGYFLMIHPLQSIDMTLASDLEVEFLDRHLAWWSQVFAGLWIAFISLMIMASLDLGSRATRWDPPFAVCGLRRGGIAMITGFAGTIAFIVVSVVLMVHLDAAAADPGTVAAALAAGGTALPFYLATVFVVMAFLASFFGRRGRSA